MTDKEIIQQMKKDMADGKVHIESKDTYRVITDGNKEIMITTPEETNMNYYKTFIEVKPAVTSSNNFMDSLPRCTIFVGPPDTGKTYTAQKICIDNNIDYVLVMGRDDLTLETLLEDFVLVDGKPTYKNSLTMDLLTSDKYGIIIIDEFNTIKTGVMKTFQPILDTTSTQFEFKGKIYKKNMNCKFIFTLNDKDKGISVLPDAILSRSKFKYFSNVNDNTLQQWTGYSPEFIKSVKDIFQFFNISNIFGTRQLNIIHGMNKDELTSHLRGLITLHGVESSRIDTPEIQSRIQMICNQKN